MEGSGIFLDSDSERCDAVKVAGQKAKRGKLMKGDSVSVGEQVAQKKKLTDITNLHQQQQLIQLANQQPKQQPAQLSAADISMDQLLKENAMLIKDLAHRNAIIESCKAEIQKHQINFQKLRKQNSELALTNSHMQAELNSSRQRLRELQLELGSKNGLLKAMKLELMAKESTTKSKHENEIDAIEVRVSQTKQSDQRDAKRKRMSKSKSSAPAITKQVTSTEKVDNQRYPLRRQSAGLKAEKPDPSEDVFEVDVIKHDVSHLQENLANENGSASLGSKVHEEAREDTESLGPISTEQVHAKRNVEKKRQSLRRQSARFGPENSEPTEDFFKIDDAKFVVPHLCDNVSEKKGSTTSSVTKGQENKACTFGPQEIRRSSVGRPLRQSVEKVQSYKEIPVNVKMRRPD